MNDHIRLELQDPKWKDQRKRYLEKQRHSNILQKGTDIAHNLKHFAEFRKDIFGGDVLESEKKLAIEKVKALEKAKSAWDGHANTIESVTAKATLSIQEQIQVLHQTLDKKEASAIGPRVPSKSTQ